MTRKNAHSFWTLQRRFAPYLFLGPFILLFSIFLLYPLARSVALSFHKTIGARHSEFVGFANYQFLLTDRVFWLSLANTVGFAIAFVLLQIPLALGLALLLNHPRVRAKAFFRAAFFSTHLTGSVFVAVLFGQLFAPRTGLLNQFLSAILHRPIEIHWLAEPTLAMASVLLASLWLSVGYAMVYFLAALQAVDQELYEAAAVDGAGRWTQFWHITLPSIRPVLNFLILVSLIGALQLFELPWVLFQQSTGPLGAGLTAVMYLFLYGTADLGYASAVGWVLAILIFGIALLQIRSSRIAREL